MRRTKPQHLLTVIGGIAFTIALLVGLMFFGGIWTTAKSYDVSVFVSDARGIAPDASVVMAGLDVGKVTGISRNGPDAILSLRINQGPTPLPVDSTVQLRLRSLAGESYVQVYPGRSKQLVRSGGSLGLSQDQDYTEVDQILNEFAGSTGGKAREFFQGVGNGVDGEGQQLNQTLGNTARLITDSLPLTSTLAAQHEQVADLVENFGNVMAAIGQRSAAVREFAAGSRVTFTAVAARDAALQSLLQQLPGALHGIRSASNTFAAVAPQIAPVLTDVGDAVHDLSPTIHELTPASARGLQLVDSLGGASPALRNVLVGLDALKKPTNSALPQVHSLLCQVDPMLRYISPYGRDIAAFFTDFGATSDSYDGNNHEFLASLLINPNTVLRGFSIPGAAALAPALDDILNSGAFGTELSPNIGFDPQPLPGGMHDTTRGAGDTGAPEFGATHKYPHVTEDCAK